MTSNCFLPRVAIAVLCVGCAAPRVREPVTISFPTSKAIAKPAPITDCHTMRMVASRDSSGAIMRVYVRVDYNGPALMTFDTGGPRTRLTHDSAKNPGDISAAGTVRLFCDDRTLDSLHQSAKNADGGYDGTPVVGVIGTDILDLGTIEVDAQRQTFTLHENGDPQGSDKWNDVPITITAGVPTLDAIVDNTPYRLEFDTGGYRALIFDPSADMSGTTTTVYDWEGNAVIMKPAVVQLVLGTSNRRVPLDRTTRYPVFEYWVKHAQVSGAVGIATIGTDRFSLSRTSSKLAP